jgi:hypothetical protein
VDGALLDNPVDLMIMHIDVLGPRMVLMVTCECDGCLVVRKECGGGCELAEHLRDEAAKLKGLLATVVAVTYSLSVVDREITSCCFEDHKMVAPLMRKA